MPALLKCDLVPIVPDAILHVHLPIIFGRSFERSGAPSEYGHARQIACDG
jgi:hypothetical protein